MSINKSIMRVQLPRSNLMSHHLLLCIHRICLNHWVTCTCGLAASFLDCSFLVAVSETFLRSTCLSSCSIRCTWYPTWFLLTCLNPSFVIIIVLIPSTIHHSCRFIFGLLFQSHEVSVVVWLTIDRTIVVLRRVYSLTILISHHALFAFLCLLLVIFLTLIGAVVRVICLETKLHTETFFILGRWEKNFQLSYSFSHFTLAACIID